MTTLTEIFTAAMALADGLGEGGSALGAETEDLRLRTPGIVNTLLAEYRALRGIRGEAQFLKNMEDTVPLVTDDYARGVLNYGLGAHLLVDENPSLASFLMRRYEELRNASLQLSEVEKTEIEDIYGGIEHSDGRWGGEDGNYTE